MSSNIGLGVVSLGVSAIFGVISIASITSFFAFQAYNYFKYKNFKGFMTSNSVLFILLSTFCITFTIENILIMIPNIATLETDIFYGFSYFIFYQRNALFVSVILATLFFWFFKYY
jgi:hypothetical protein